MMTYLYQCLSCGERTEWKYRMGKQPETARCRECDGEAERVFTPLVVLYRGRGWASHGLPDLDTMKKQDPLDFSDLEG